jgi:hypothetical protein
MSCVISGKVVVATSAGGVTGQNAKAVYLQPSRNNFQFTTDGGTTWYTWEGDPNLSASYPGAIAATTDVNGNFAFTVPYTDTECASPTGAPVPDLYWNIIDPNPTAGPLVFWGRTDSAIVGASKTLKQLITLPVPDDWQVGNVTYSATPAADERYATVAFTSASTAGAVTFPTLNTTAWTFTYGVESDDGRQYTVNLDTATKTDTGAALTLSDLPAVGKTVRVHLHVRAS